LFIDYILWQCENNKFYLKLGGGYNFTAPTDKNSVHTAFLAKEVGGNGYV